MNYKQKLFYAFAGFLIGNIIIALLGYGIYSIANYQSSKNEISFDEALQRIQSKQIKEVYIKGDKADLIADEKTKYSADVSDNQTLEIMRAAKDGVTIKLEPISSNPLDKLFQILFILFIISPPIIVVLLLIIIKKMKSNDSMN